LQQIVAKAAVLRSYSTRPGRRQISTREDLHDARDFERPHIGARAPEAIATGLFGLAVLTAVVLRWFHLGSQSLWYDEGYTALASGLSPANVVRFARSDTYPPLYPLLQHYWGVLFGNSEFALRGVSAFSGTLSVPVFYLLAKKVLEDSMAVALATWLFAFSIMQIWYSQEARTYELASFLALVGLYALVLFLERRSAASFATIVLAATASLYSHNMMFFYLLALNVTWLIYPSERAWSERARELLLADVLAGVLYLPWIPSLLAQIAYVHQGFWVPKPTISTFFQTLTLIAGFYPDYLTAVAARFSPLSSGTAWVCVLAGVSLLCAALVAGGLWRVPRAQRSRNIALLLYCLLPILLVFLLSQITRSLYINRVFTNSSVVVPLVFAYPLALRKGRRERILFGFLGIVLALTTALSAFGYLRDQEKEDWRGAATSLLRIPERNRLIVFAPTAGEILFDYYAQRFPRLGPSVAKMGLPMSHLEDFPPRLGAITSLNDIAPLKLAVESGKYSEIDLVLSTESPDDLNRLILDYLNQVSIRRLDQQFRGVRIERFLAPRH
jgi:4-amino-4-deoxy-L-arabinose transferase-like glycosyltransferase